MAVNVELAQQIIDLIDAAIAESLATGKLPTVSYTLGGVSKTYTSLATLQSLRGYYQGLADKGTRHQRSAIAQVPLVRRRLRSR